MPNFESIADAIKRINSERSVDHDCNQHLDLAPSEYPDTVNAVSRKCRICGGMRYNSIKPIRADKWKQLCPAIYQSTEPHRLPSPVKLDRVLRWSYGPMGLIMFGPSGTGKSRCAWLLMRQEMKGGKSALFLDASVSYDYTETFSKSASDSSKWIAKHAVVDLLLLDDVFKGKLSDGLEQAVYSIISLRTENEKPTILTLNDVGETLLARMSPDRGPALVRRLREFCEMVSFSKSN